MQNFHGKDVAHALLKDRMNEAAQQRAVADHDGEFERKSRRPLFGPLLARLGDLLVDMGKHLQDHYRKVETS